MTSLANKRHITSFGVKNLRYLRAFKNVKTVRQLRVLNPGMSDDDIYFTIATAYNNAIDEHKRRTKGAARDITDFLSSMASLPVEEPSKRSREERLARHMTLTSLPEHTIDMKTKTRYNRKALNGVFEDVVYAMNHVDENMYRNHFAISSIVQELIYNTVMERYSKQSLERNLHVGLLIDFRMETELKGEGTAYHEMHFNSEHVVRVLSAVQIKEWAAMEMDRFFSVLGNIGRSNLLFSGIDKVHLQFSEKRKIRGGTYIELPKVIQLKHACVNIKNDDQKCLVWALLAHKYYDTLTRKDKNFVQCYKAFESEIVIPDGVAFPVCSGDIPKVEKANNLKINVFRLDSGKLQTIYNTMQRNDNVVNLLLLEDGKTTHYVWIRNLARLLCINKNNEKTYACSQCLSACYDSNEKLQEHLKLCMQHKAVRVVLPKEGKNIIKFRNYGRSFKHPFAVFMDFESTLEPYDDVKSRDAGLKVEKCQKHSINSVGYKYNCIYDEHSEPLRLINNANP